MSAFFPYTIYHLGHEELLRINQLPQDELMKEQIQAKTAYQHLLSNRPRADISVYKTFSRSIVEVVEKEREFEQADKQNEVKQQLFERKVKSVKMLFKMDYYVPVANVESDTAEQAIEMCSNINQVWYLKPHKKINILPDAHRSTSHYDIIQRFDEYFLMMPLGIINLSKSKWADELV